MLFLPGNRVQATDIAARNQIHSKLHQLNIKKMNFVPIQWFQYHKIMVKN